MNKKNKIKRGNEVVVISGSEKGQRGKVLEIFRAKKRVVVEGLALKKKCTKATQNNPKGGITEQESSIDISNVMLAEKFDAKKSKN